MPDKEKHNEESTPVEKKSNMLMIIIIVVLILIILIGAVVTILLMGSEEEKAPASSAPQVKEKSVSKQTRSSSSQDDGESRQLNDIGILYPLDTFTVNLKSDAGRRYLKVTMSLELEGAELSLELDNKSPVIRDRVIRILTSKTLEEISSKKGKQKISDQIIDTLNAMIKDGQIRGIYFTEFVIQ
ncbi:MAG: flagellar basal body-associated protein FliL [Epsilonproteobacteria bacterium]|nr:flagellar basal body-associated protein FliL [Campylobacterota bacterium]OIO14790.1 MAG: flagellar basal body protein FliL [Helicobacteraceae bacterium CG1_02_36_14]PIP09257.1 MAG: flagellar basal body protein FliL [Sulfurimonas sp. CG23_combo_of_CG06-09_8_20_14_all_36_33]PIS25731.1 MAG: flagellar basal body protein FliL [Sulfurimonas sp. CG08_land_8_20_14_0_20_36_33]PIU34579.1 MAG: flagellar basal body protein FliL [Sulfurimonas sp. CG07_land_8_20_14_0_80_36_56]PIV04788.1 MAG: flagellar ba